MFNHKQLIGKLIQKRDAVRSWVIDRFGLGPIADFAVFRRTPKTPWYYGGGASLLLLLFVLVGTGMFLSLGYSPSEQEAYDSIDRITNETLLGWFVRGLHYWSAGFMVVLLIYHMFRHLILGGYKPPREGVWLLGVGLFLLVIVNAFIGYTLRWDEQGISGLRVALHIFSYVPWIGDDLVRIVIGSEQLGTETIGRLFAVHAVIVPILLLGLVFFHLYLVILHGVTTKEERTLSVESAEEQRSLKNAVERSTKLGTDFYPNTAAKSAVFAFIVFAVVLTLTLLIGAPELGPRPNELIDAQPREEWWFAWYSGLIALLPSNIAQAFYVAFPLTVIFILAGLPFLDKGDNRGARNRPFAVVITSCATLAILGFAGYRLRSPFIAWPTSQLPPLPPGVQLTESTAKGRAYFTEYGCYSCHGIGGNGSGFGPDITSMDKRLSPQELRQIIEQPPAHYAMPAYRDRASDEVLTYLVEFVLVAQTFPRTYGGKDQ